MYRCDSPQRHPVAAMHMLRCPKLGLNSKPSASRTTVCLMVNMHPPHAHIREVPYGGNNVGGTLLLLCSQ
jgi:hypothetical protein